MAQQFFSARDLGWRIVEPDQVTPLTVIRTIMAPTLWNARFELAANATVVTP